MKVLQVIECAYRATIEEQDDTILWISHALRGAGADLTVLLRGNAVNYAIQGQDASGVAFGSWRQSQPPRIAADVAGLVEKGVPVLALEEDLRERGIDISRLVEGVRPVPRSHFATLVETHDQVWHW